MKKSFKNSGATAGGAKAVTLRRGKIALAAVGIIALGGVIGGGLSLFDQSIGRANPSNALGSPGRAALTFAGHVAEPFIPCSTDIAECFRKAKVASSVRLGPAIPRAASRSTGPRSRSIPGRDGPVGSLFDEALPLIPSFPGQFAFGGVPTGGFAGAPFGPFPGALVPGGIGGGVPATPGPTPAPSPGPTDPGTPAPTPTPTPTGPETPVPPGPDTPTPTPTPTPTGPDTPGPNLPETPVPAVPEPATWLQMLLGFAIVGTALRRITGRGTAGRRMTGQRAEPALS